MKSKKYTGILIFLIIIFGSVLYNPSSQNEIGFIIFTIGFLGLVSLIIYYCCKNAKIYKKSLFDINKIDNMQGYQFEQFTAYLLKELGYKNISVTSKSNDYGIDVIASKNGIKYGIQCKRYSRKLGNSPVQEVSAGIRYYGCDVAVVITNNYFTQNTINLSKANNVVLWDRNDLINMLNQVNKKEQTETRKEKKLDNSDNIKKTESAIQKPEMINISISVGNGKEFSTKINNTVENIQFINNLENSINSLSNIDELLYSASAIVINNNNVSASLLQRNLMVGYMRASNIIDQLQTLEIVDKCDSSCRRKVLVDETVLPIIEYLMQNIPNEKFSSNYISDNKLCYKHGDEVNQKVIIGVNESETAYEIDMSNVGNILITGASGTGKTSFVQSLIIQLIENNEPADVKFLIYDYKKIDYQIFENYLLVPIISDDRRLLGALIWLQHECDERHKKLLQINASNVQQYNDLIDDDEMFIPEIYVILDDFYNVNTNHEIIDAINTLKNIGLSVGVHMILVTSIVNHDTSLIDISARISFYVFSKRLSKLIINQSGAQLLKVQCTQNLILL